MATVDNRKYIGFKSSELSETYFNNTYFSRPAVGVDSLSSSSASGAGGKSLIELFDVGVKGIPDVPVVFPYLHGTKSGNTYLGFSKYLYTNHYKSDITNGASIPGIDIEEQFGQNETINTTGNNFSLKIYPSSTSLSSIYGDNDVAHILNNGPVIYGSNIDSFKNSGNVETGNITNITDWQIRFTNEPLLLSSTQSGENFTGIQSLGDLFSIYNENFKALNLMGKLLKDNIDDSIDGITNQGTTNSLAWRIKRMEDYFTFATDDSDNIINKIDEIIKWFGDTVDNNTPESDRLKTITNEISKLTNLTINDVKVVSTTEPNTGTNIYEAVLNANDIKLSKTIASWSTNTTVETVLSDLYGRKANSIKLSSALSIDGTLYSISKSVQQALTALSNRSSSTMASLISVPSEQNLIRYSRPSVEHMENSDDQYPVAQSSPSLINSSSSIQTVLDELITFTNNIYGDLHPAYARVYNTKYTTQSGSNLYVNTDYINDSYPNIAVTNNIVPRLFYYKYLSNTAIQIANEQVAQYFENDNSIDYDLLMSYFYADNSHEIRYVSDNTIDNLISSMWHELYDSGQSYGGLYNMTLKEYVDATKEGLKGINSFNVYKSNNNYVIAPASTVPPDMVVDHTPVNQFNNTFNILQVDTPSGGQDIDYAFSPYFRQLINEMSNVQTIIQNKYDSDTININTLTHAEIDELDSLLGSSYFTSNYVWSGYDILAFEQSIGGINSQGLPNKNISTQDLSLYAVLEIMNSKREFNKYKESVEHRFRWLIIN